MTAPQTTRSDRPQAQTRGVLLDLMLAAIALVAVAAAVAAVVLPVNQLTQPGGAAPVELTEPAQRQAFAAVSGLPTGSWLQPAADGSLMLHAFRLGWPTRLLTEAGPSLVLACLAGSGLLLYRTIRSIRLGTPFDPSNPRRLRLIGLLLLIGGLGSQLLAWAAGVAVLDAIGLASDAGPVRIPATIDLSWAVAGICSLALAEAFARGRALNEDLDGLV